MTLRAIWSRGWLIRMVGLCSGTAACFGLPFDTNQGAVLRGGLPTAEKNTYMGGENLFENKSW